ncbi:MAG: hypothetical protein HONBIEJF_01002 [Fimbriimonadaceae bacterium]|nr:hypothetical protein [Fimbriimonadaceae bacterium]
MRRAFTLIELLVVIAIIAILAAILFPVFASAKAKGQQTVCLSNVKQLGLGFRMYMDDFDQKYPGAGCLNVRGGWVDGRNLKDASKGEIYPYLKNKQVYMCPMDPKKQRFNLSFSMNTCIHRIKESAINFSSRTILLLEESETSVDGNGLNDGCFVPHYNNDLSPIRHSGGGNYVLADTSAKWLSARDIRDPKADQQRGAKWPWLNPYRLEEESGEFDSAMRGACEVALRGP